MTISDTKKAQILAALLTIAGLAWFFAFRMSGPETTRPGIKPKANIVKRHLKDPTIQLGWVEKTAIHDGGRKNIFQYEQKLSSQSTGATRTTPARTVVDTTTLVIPPPVPPQLPPSKAFKYEGFSARSTSASGKILASLSDGGNTYTVRLGECLMGRYCVRQLTENMIEIEDLETRQLRTVPKTLQ